MKHLLLSLLLAIPTTLLAQIVPSNCNSNAQLDSLYTDASKRIALRHIWSTDSVNRNEPIIHQTTIDTFMNALVAVHNVQNMPARDSVIDMYHVHIDYDITMRHFSLTADTSSSWLAPLRDSILPCGSSIVDSIHTEFGLTVTDYDDFTWFTQPRNYHRVSFKSDTDLNLVGLSSVLLNNSTILTANMDEIIRIPEASSDDIRGKVFPDHVELTYKKCFTKSEMCLAIRFWVFKVYYDCSVEFVESYGDRAWPVGIDKRAALTDIQVYPNPVSSDLTIYSGETIKSVSIYSSTGQLVKEFQNPSSYSYDVNELPSGSYLIQIQTDSKEHTQRIVKM
jgi:hypothetical protein